MTLFKEKSKIGILQKNTSNNKIKTWFSKWDRTIAAITGVIIFCVVLVIVILNVKTSSDAKEDGVTEETANYVLNNEESPRFAYDEIKSVPKCSWEDGSAVVCRKAEVTALCKEITEFLENQIEQSLNQLKLIDTNYTNNLIEKGWLNCSLPFSELTITDSTLNNISKNAFEGAAFTNVKVLTLETSINSFRRDMFESLYIERLQITCRGYADFEDNVFGALFSTLNILQLQNCLTQTTSILPSILGASEELRALKELDLRGNSLRKITAGSFKSATNLEALYLSDSNVMEIELGTFDGLFLNKLDLCNNALKTLPEGIFDSIKSGITLTGNQFICDCDLVWLKNLVQTQSFLFSPISFTCFPNVDFSKVTFCPNDTTTEVQPTDATTQSSTSTRTPSTSAKTTSSTYTTTTSPYPDTTISEVTPTSTSFMTTTLPFSTHSPPTTTTPASNIKEIQCWEADTEPSDLELASSISLSIREDNIYMNFSIENNVTYVYIIGSLDEQSSLLWFPTDNKNETQCRTNISLYKPIKIGSLSKDRLYIFCVMSENTLSPYDCGAYKLPFSLNGPPYTTWLTNDEMIPFIAGIIGSLLVVSLVTGLIVFYCIRQNPSLIKGNKRVIIVESEAADAIIMPSYYSEPHYRPPTLNSYSNGYLTPKRHVVYHYPTPRSHLRTISEHTDFVVPSTSTGGRYKKGQYRKRTKLEHVSKSFDENLYESPPPLPPNHPLGSFYSDGCRSYSHV